MVHEHLRVKIDLTVPLVHQKGEEVLFSSVKNSGG
jgi:hypothetical protein